MVPKADGKKKWPLYGLYYLDDDTALVISRDGRPIPPKENDPEAPTLPGFHVRPRYFKFAISRLSDQGFSFRTERIEGTEYSFTGKFGTENVDVIEDVPYLAGTLTERRNGRIVRRKAVHFSHAVIL